MRLTSKVYGFALLSAIAIASISCSDGSTPEQSSKLGADTQTNVGSPSEQIVAEPTRPSAEEEEAGFRGGKYNSFIYKVVSCNISGAAYPVAFAPIPEMMDAVSIAKAKRVEERTGEIIKTFLLAAHNYGLLDEYTALLEGYQREIRASKVTGDPAADNPAIMSLALKALTDCQSLL